jgi:mono/diheme cytochrome c family protein
VVVAAQRRKRIPFWAAPVLALLPLWAFIYLNAMKPPPAGENDPLAIGAEVYSSAGCAGCHGADGAGAKAGGVGQQLSDGHVLETFKDPLAMAHWIRFGADGGARADGTYGDLDRPGGPMNINTLSAKMSAFPDLSAEEMAALIIYVREGLSGGKPEDDPNFNVDTFEADPAPLEKAIDDVTALGPGGDPDIASVQGAETEQ